MSYIKAIAICYIRKLSRLRKEATVVTSRHTQDTKPNQTDPEIKPSLEIDKKN